MDGRRLAAAWLLALLAWAPGRTQTLPTAVSPLCGTRPAPPPVWDHVVWIWFENHGFNAVVGAREARNINRHLIPSCGLATNYHSLAHPSVPNYIAATSGLPLSALGALRHDCNATGPCRTNAPSIFALAPTWGAYAESMRRPCTHWFTGAYAASHNPAVYYTGLQDCRTNDVSLGALRPALASDTLPAFVFITPNMCHSMHNCSVASGDRWLWGVIKRLTASPTYLRGTTAVFVTFDESGSGDSDDRVMTLVISPSTVPHTRSSRWFNHYSLLRTSEELLGIDRLLGEASRAPSMRAAFNL